jgi:hypothetical protein
MRTVWAKYSVLILLSHALQNNGSKENMTDLRNKKAIKFFNLIA